MRCKNFNCQNPSGKVDIQTRKDGTQFWECPDCGCMGDLDEIPMMQTNWKQIDEAIVRESQAEDCMIPMRDRC